MTVYETHCIVVIFRKSSDGIVVISPFSALLQPDTVYWSHHMPTTKRINLTATALTQYNNTEIQSRAIVIGSACITSIEWLCYTIGTR